MIVEVHCHNHTPADWQATITGVAAEFFHQGGGQSQDNKTNINLPAGNGEAVLYSANVDCITTFTVHMSVRDRTGRFQIITRSFKDPHGNPCVDAGQDCNLGQAPATLIKLLGVPETEQAFEITEGK